MAPSAPATPPTEPTPRRLGCWFRAACVIVGVWLRIPGMHESLWYDEVFRTRIFLNESIIKRLLLHDVHNPLYNALMYAWIRVFGESEPSIRVPSLLCFAVLALAAWRWVRTRFGTLHADLVFAWLCFSPVMVWFSTEAKNNMFVAMWVALATIACDRVGSGLGGHQRPRNTARACWAACTGACAILTSFTSLLGLWPVWLWLVIRAWKQRKAVKAGRAPHDASPTVLHTLVAILGAFALCSPLLFFKAARLNELPRGYLGYMSVRDVLDMLTVWIPTGRGYFPREVWKFHWALAFFALFFAALLFLGGTRLRKTPSGRLACAGLFLPVVGLAIASDACVALEPWIGWVRIYQERNLFCIAWLFPVVAFAGALTLPRVVKAAACVCVLGATLGASIASNTIHADKWTIAHDNPDWRGAIELVRTRARQLDAGVLVVARSHDPTLLYYLAMGEQFPHAAIIAPRGPPLIIEDQLAEISAILISRPELTRVAVVETDYSANTLGTYPLPVDRFRAAEMSVLKGVRVTIFERK